MTGLSFRRIESSVLNAARVHASRSCNEGNALTNTRLVVVCFTVVEFGCWKVVNQMSYLTVGSLENTSRLVDVSLNWTINSTG